MRSKTLITGSNGMLGHACREVIPEAAAVTRKDADLRNLDQTEDLFHEYKPVKVLHCAAVVGGVKANAARNAEFFAENLQINTNVLATASQGGVMQLISFLSSCTYKLYEDKPSTEDDLHRGEPFEGNSGYSWAKRMLDLQSRLICKQYGYQYATLTPVTMFGPHDHYDLENSHVLSALIHKCYVAKRDHSVFDVWGSGRAVRQFVYVKDVARFLKEYADDLPGDETLILAPDEGMTIRTLAEKIADAMKFDGQIRFDASKPEGQIKRVIKSRKFEKLFPGFKFTPFDKALEETIQWFEKHYAPELETGRVSS